jgi:hypothetical protein
MIPELFWIVVGAVIIGTPLAVVLAALVQHYGSKE